MNEKNGNDMKAKEGGGGSGTRILVILSQKKIILCV